MIRKNDIELRTYKNAVYWVVQNIDDYEQLKSSVYSNLYKHVQG